MKWNVDTNSQERKDTYRKLREGTLMKQTKWQLCTVASLNGKELNRQL